jgi:DNA (cytosine-5)-methyltransferase 1
MRVFSVFSGIGAHDYGFEQSGHTIVGQVEWDAYCSAVLEKHWPLVPRWSDVHDVTTDDVIRRCGRIDILIGAPPCQAASVAGKRLGCADERWLWPEYLRLVVGLRPRWICSENVPGFLSLGESGAVFADLEAASYEVWPLVVGAWAVGAPHKRERVWIVGRRVAHAMPSGLASQCYRRDGTTGRSESDAIGSGADVADATQRGQRTDGRASGRSGHPDEQGAGNLEHPISTGLRTGWECGARRIDERCALRWPSRPGDQQHDWEAPRLVHAQRAERWAQAEGRDERNGDDSRRQETPSGDTEPTPGERGPVEPGLGVPTPRATRRLVSFARRNALKALGNANPPWVPYLIGRWMMAENKRVMGKGGGR